MVQIVVAFDVWNSCLGATLLPDPRIDLVAIKPPFVEDFFGGYFPLPGKLVERSSTDLQVLRKLLDGHDRTDHLTPSSQGLAVDGVETQKGYQFGIQDKTSDSEPMENSPTYFRSTTDRTKPRERKTTAHPPWSYPDWPLSPAPQKGPLG